MTEKMSNAAMERAAAQRALANGELKERDTYTAKQIAMRCGTDAKTMRKFFRSDYSTVEPVGQGGRYEFDAADLPLIKKEFAAWLGRNSVTKRQGSTPKPKPQLDSEKEIEALRRAVKNSHEGDTELDQEPTEEDLLELEVVEDLDLDDLED